MSLVNNARSWGIIAKLFHWLSLILLIMVWVAILWHEATPRTSAAFDVSLLLHKTFGLSLGALVLARLGWRLTNVTPAPLPGPVWQHRTALVVHSLLYVVLLAMPLTGLLMSQLAGKSVSWFGVFDVPQLLDVNKALAGDIKELHEDVFWLLLVLLTLAHIGAAVYHQAVLKDSLIKRML